MQRCICFLIGCLPFPAVLGQYYFTGEIKDINGQVLPFVNLYLHKNNAYYFTGSSGVYGLPSAYATDSVTITLAGYESRTALLTAGSYQVLQLKPTLVKTVRQSSQLRSLMLARQTVQGHWWQKAGETYSQLLEHAPVNTRDFPATSFALNIDKAAYSNIRRMLQQGMRVPPDAVRIEEMLNYFPANWHAPDSGQVFQLQTQLTDCPWNAGRKLLLLRTHAKRIAADALPPANLVFLIDVSGSMEPPNRLPLLKAAFRMLVQHLRPVDTISIMVYGGAVGVVLPPTSGACQQRILNVIDSLEAGGDTPGESAIRQAYALARNTFIKGGNNRVILATDGDFNVGESSEEALMELIAQNRQRGIYLTCLGVGMGNYKDSRLEVLAKKGNGNFAYLDRIGEAEKVLIQEFAATLYAVADDAYMQVQFDTATVRRYRLIGFENHAGSTTDTAMLLEGGEIGSGHVATALFEIEPAAAFADSAGLQVTATISYLLPGSEQRNEQSFAFRPRYQTLAQADSSARLAAAVAFFGMLLRQSPYLNQVGWNDLLRLLVITVQTNDRLQTELQALAYRAKDVYEPPKRKPALRKKRKPEKQEVLTGDR